MKFMNILKTYFVDCELNFNFSISSEPSAASSTVPLNSAYPNPTAPQPSVSNQVINHFQNIPNIFIKNDSVLI